MFKHYYKYLKPFYPYYIRCFMLFIMIDILSLVNPLMLKVIIDNVLPNKDISLLIILLISIIVITLMNSGLNFITNYMYIHLSQKIGNTIKLDFITHLFHLPQSFFDKTTTGELINRIEDTDVIINIFDTLYFDALLNGFTFIIFFTVSIIINPFLSIVSLVSIPIYYIISNKIGEIKKRRNQTLWEKSNKIEEKLIESCKGIGAIKIVTGESSVIKFIRLLFLDLRKFTMTSRLILNIGKIIDNFLNTLFKNAVLFLGVLFIIKGKMTLGDWFAYSAISAQFVTSMVSLAEVFQNMKQYSAPLERMDKILKIPKEPRVDKQYSIISKGEIKFINVSFGYDELPYLLTNVSFDIPSHSIVALIGKSGAGKTSLGNLLLSLYFKKQGRILIDGMDIESYDIHYLRKKVGLVRQDVDLFSGSIKDNLTLGLDSFAMEDIIDSCEKANALEFIENLPKKFDTILGEEGAILSGGQKQRLAIARVLLRKPKIIIFDEATSHLDYNSIKLFHDAIEKIKSNHTILIISHMETTINKADHIYYLDNGTIAKIDSYSDYLNLLKYVNNINIDNINN